MKDKVRQIVLASCREHNDVSETRIDIGSGDEAALFGIGGALDSIALVSLIVAVEQAIEAELDVLVTLADDKAASQKTSPFRTIGALVEYTTACVEEELSADD
ncbi:hypothetical protein [Nisaea sp.]|uniref:hypothetical protein n=1 Tax=Nisaea sp. TaxID=2024842 RepID=UPI0032EEEF7F